MRVLLGPLNPRDHRPVVGDLDGLDVLCFDRRHAEVIWTAGEPFSALWNRLPSGWSPDILIWWSPEYSCLPEGLEDCPVSTLAVLGDWNLGLSATAPLLEAFDGIVTDRKGVATLGPQLETPVDYWPAFSFDPAVHRRLPDTTKEWDICFVGNFNHEVQAERARWLLRLARLCERYRVVLATGVYGEAYARLLNASRIVFNRSIRSELNMRAYETPACGALLFMEEDNMEAAEVFAPGKECVFYDEATLEPLLHHYLAHPEALDRIAEAGWRRVQSETYRIHLERLFDRLPSGFRGPRPFQALPAWRRPYWVGMKALGSPHPWRFTIARAHFEQALRADAPASPVAAAFGAIFATQALGLSTPERAAYLASAERLLTRALGYDPQDAITHMTLGRVRLERGDLSGAEREWLDARAILESERPFAVDRFPVPFPYDRFRVQWEQAATELEHEARAARIRPLLLARVSAALAGLADRASDSAAALSYWAESVKAAPGLDGNLFQLGESLDGFGQATEALETFRQAVEVNPFHFEARARAAGLATQLGDLDSATRLVSDGRALTATAPCYQNYQALFDSAEAELVGRVSA